MARATLASELARTALLPLSSLSTLATVRYHEIGPAAAAAAGQSAPAKL